MRVQVSTIPMQLFVRRESRRCGGLGTRGKIDEQEKTTDRQCDEGGQSRSCRIRHCSFLNKPPNELEPVRSNRRPQTTRSVFLTHCRNGNPGENSMVSSAFGSTRLLFGPIGQADTTTKPACGTYCRSSDSDQLTCPPSSGSVAEVGPLHRRIDPRRFFYNS